MYFCDNCGFSLEISKSSKISKEEDNRQTITKLAEAIKMVEDNIDITNYKANFSKDEMTKNKKYQKMSDDMKINMNRLFEEQVSSGAEFKCENCNLTKSITETTMLYQINMEDKINTLKTLEENELVVKDPLLPHTHDYTCKNPSCVTHKKPEMKDAVFLRDRNSYKINYICSVCFFNW
jgi:hypothetical protein